MAPLAAAEQHVAASLWRRLVVAAGASAAATQLCAGRTLRGGLMSGRVCGADQLYADRAPQRR